MWIKAKAPRARLPLAIALLLAWWLACWLATGAWFDDETQEAYRAENGRAERFVADAIPGYNRIIGTRSGVMRMLVRDPEIRRTLARFGAAPPPPPVDEEERRRRWSADPELAQINRFLDASARDLGLDALVLLDANGDCVAASNASSERSIVGASYGDRNDFQNARAGRSGYLATMGKKMGSTGLTFYAPVVDHGHFIGAVIGGNALAPFANLIDQADAFLSDRNGVVVLARDPSLLLHALPDAPVGQLDAATRQALYQRTELPTLALTPWGNARYPELLRVEGRVAPTLLRSHSAADGGLTLSVLWPMPQLAALAQQRLVYAGALGCIGTLLMLLATAYLTRRRERRVMALSLAERERSATQSRNFLDQIVNAIADPLFVKDREHRWVLVNQAFCKIHGQPRENFIGKSARDAFPERIAQGIWDADERVLTAGIEIIVEEKLTDSQGVTHIVVTKKAPYTDAAGQRFIVGIISDISERKQMERLLRAKEREFRNLAENNPDVIIRYDRECRRIYVNQALATMAGREAKELVGRLSVDHTPLTDPESYMAELRRVMESGAPSSFDVLVRRANGEAGWYAISMVAEFDEGDQVVGVLAVARDITERKAMEETLALREQEYRSLAENLPDNVTRWDVDGCYLYINSVHERTLGVSKNDMIGKAIPDSHTFVREAIAQVVATGQAAMLVRQSVVVDGETQIHDVSLAPEHDAEGHLVSVLGIGRDMTDIYRMQDAVAAREAEFRALVDQAPEPIFRYAPDGRRIYVNAAVESISGIPASVLLGGPSSDGKILPAHDGAAMVALVRRICETGEPGAIEVENVGADGRLRHFHNRLAPEFGADGKVRSVFSICHDITERKQAEDALRKSEEKLRGLYELSPLGIALTDMNGGYLEFNEAFRAICGYPADELKTLGYWDLTPREYEPREAEQLESLSRSGRYGPYEKEYRQKDGKRIPIQLSGMSVTGKDGQKYIWSIVEDITSRRRMEDELQRGRLALEDAQRIGQIGSWELDLVSGVLNWSDETYRMFEIDPAVFGASMDAFINVIHPEDRERVNAAYDASIKNRIAYDVEHRLLLPNGRIKDVRERGETWYDADGRPLRSLGTVQDITNRRRAEVALQENFDRITGLNLHLEKQALELRVSQEQLKLTEAWYRGILYSAPDGMLVIDGHGVIMQVNAQLEIMFGYDGNELIGNCVEMLLPAAIREIHLGKRIDFVTSGRMDRPMTTARHLRACRKDGSEFPVDVSLSRLPDIAGRVGVICAAIRDITERKRMEDALHAREQAFRALVENSPDAVSRYDLDCRRIYVNPAVERIAGIPAAALLGKTPIEGPIDGINLGEKQLACIQQVQSTGAPAETELAWVHADGTPQQFHMHFVPEYGRDGLVTSVLAVGRDISARKLAEERLRESRDIVRALAAHQETKHEKERKELAYQIHEDLAQNLAALRLNISLFEMSGESAPRAPLLKTMRDIADRSITRIRDIVSVLRPTVLDLGLIPALHWLTDDFKGFGFHFDLALQEEIFISDEASTLLFRAAQEALLNIALHAAATHVHVSLATVAGVCRLVVRDNGCGFDPAAPRREGRFGLIRLTEQSHHLGGDLSIDSRPDQGTALEFHVPAFPENRSPFSK